MSAKLREFINNGEEIIFENNSKSSECQDACIDRLYTGIVRRYSLFSQNLLNVHGTVVRENVCEKHNSAVYRASWINLPSFSVPNWQVYINFL